MMNDQTIHPAVREAALRSLHGGGRAFWLIATPLALLVALGAAAYAYQLREGLGVTGLNDQVFWGIYTANFVTFIGISYGGAVVSAVLRLSGASWRAPITRLAEAMAVVSLAVGGLFVIIHLGQPLRVGNMIVHAQISSPLFWDMVAIATYMAGTIIFLYLPLIPDIAVCRDRAGSTGLRHRLYTVLSLGWQGTPEQRRVLTWGVALMAVIIIPLAVAVHSVLAWAFAVTSRTGWHSTIFGPYFVVAALFSGVATVILVVAAFRKAYHLEAYIEEKHFRNLGYMMMGLGILYLYFTFSEFLTEGYVLDKEVQGLYESLLVTTYAPMFWAFVVGGMAIPIAIVALPRTRTISWIVVAAALAVTGMWLKRFLIVVPPLAGESSYTPSWVEILVTVGALAAIPLLLMFFVRVFPLLSIWEMEEVAVADESQRHSTVTPAPVASRTSGVVSRIAGWLVVGAVVVLAVNWSGAATASSVLAQEPIEVRDVHLTFEQPATRGDTVSLPLRLTADDGQPITRARVEFSVSPDFFGERPLRLQTAITNSDGVASLKYVPTWDGAHKMTAKFGGNADYLPGEATAIMTVSGTVTAFSSEGETLHFLRLWSAPAVTVGAVIVWLFLAGVLIRVVWGVSRASDRNGEYESTLPSTAAKRLYGGSSR